MTTKSPFFRKAITVLKYLALIAVAIYSFWNMFFKTTYPNEQSREYVREQMRGNQ